MPPKFKFSKEEIIKSAVNVTRRLGLDSLNARDIAKELGVSTQPVFTCFGSMEEAKKEVCKEAERIFDEYLMNGMKSEISFLGCGKAYIEFAKNEPRLYELLFLSPSNEYSKNAVAMKNVQKAVRPTLEKIYRLDDKQADRLFRDLWIVSHSICSLIVTGNCPFSDDEITKILADFSLSVCKSLKEIDGFADDSYDKNAVFSKLTEK